MPSDDVSFPGHIPLPDRIPFPDHIPTAGPGSSPDVVDVDARTIAIGSAIERLLARFEAFARQAARSRGLTAVAVDEVLQDVRIRLWKSQPTSEKIEQLGASYLLKVVSSAVIDHLRRQRRRRETPIDFELESDVVPQWLLVEPQDTAAQQALAARLERALDQLPRNRRVVVQLHLEGYERTEITGMTGWSEAKVRNLLYRGLDDLRAHWRSHRGTLDD